MRLLLVEDELEMAAALSAALSRYDMILDHAPSIDHAMAALASQVHDGIILDRQLPDGDGLSLIPRVRALRSGIPVIVLTARSAIDERVRGLDMGADDYLAKPFAVEELLARIRALMRRSPDIAPITARIGQLIFDFEGRQARVDGRVLDLPRRELLVLEALARRQGRTVQRSTLEESVYGYDDEIQSNSLDAHVSRLRRKLSETGAGVEIHSIRGVGYLLRPSP
ncbi:response regulator transcription factor [Ensifer adhaerens]|uniref:Response regulator transcription factor n=1 Tax=Ensifer adhaerens TaxID=106592 RepID=A0ABY8HPA7_ENSAD|nr:MULTISPECIES: response regulator transcription factor [Ensifer]ANK76124.1 DNA-binding response regulator [Ensifer adhaerens]KDP70484.1 transcriptional regulator [Ensifer adhaerens]KQZ40773.1 two-component system response regulator [Ensifer sp. Root558]MBD9494119.1 response regulator transcription factor [Ensifer sp. ENS01]MBD9539446.1 response regulator transcription factor [Ensifer sp. ENS04]